MAMKRANAGTVPVYTVSGPSSRSLPDSLIRKKKNSLKNDPEFANRVELLQDFEFSGASNCVQVSEDGNWVMSSGTYPPQFRVHDLHQLSLSYSRHTVSLNKKFVLLTPDCSKSAHLQEDRRIELHTLAGCHAHVRIPRYGRDIAYVRRNCDLLVPAAGLDADGYGEVFRLNLREGRFKRSFRINLEPDDGVERGLQGSIGVACVNTVAVAEESHGIMAFGTSLGSIEFWDPRLEMRAATLETDDGEITALNFARSGLTVATGSSNGIVKLYDLRNPIPLVTKDLGFGFPVQNLIHLTTASEERKILASDKRSIKIFDEYDGKPWTNIEPDTDLNFVTHCPDSGMLLSANEGQQQHAWFIPSLGPSPKWCSFLERLVDEMAEDVSTTTYDNYKFLTRPELRSLNLDHLVGKTHLLRPYMHGYFVASKLYDQARLIANPYVYEEERHKHVKEKIDKERASRIRGTKKVKVNQKLVDNLLKKQAKRDTVDTEAGILGEDRFKALFEDDAFAVDETSAEFRALNASTKVEVSDEPAKPSRVSGNNDSNTDTDDDSDDAIRLSENAASARKSSDGVRMSSSAQLRGARMKDRTIGSRAQKMKATGHNVIRKAGRDKVVGEREVTFVPEAKKEGAAAERPAKRDNRVRRSASGNTFRNLKQ